jgi:hypothetical protein
MISDDQANIRFQYPLNACLEFYVCTKLPGNLSKRSGYNYCRLPVLRIVLVTCYLDKCEFIIQQ